jgi:EAL domain-containing protein (putative c-di-GMP-specific phosphodiesterase class I)/CheY-like chemotaxis protein
MEGLVAPSKFYSALAAGRPVAVICEKHSYLRALVSDANCGAAFNNGDSQGLAGFIRYLAKDPEMTQRMGKCGHRYVQEYFTPQLTTQQYFRNLYQAVVRHADLSNAFEQQEFQVYYQPIVALGSERPIGFEATIRWQHPLRGLICPAEFAAAAADMGLLVPLGWWMLEEACRQLQDWRSHAPHLNLKMHVNLASPQFYHPDLVPQLDRLLERHELSGHSLVLEVADRIVTEDTAATTAVLLQLQTRGIEVYINQFGASYTSFDYLHRFPIAGLKVARSLVNRIGIDLESVKLIETVVVLAKDLGMVTICDGIESLEQLRRLKEIGLQTGQGHLFAPALPPEQVEPYLQWPLNHSQLEQPAPPTDHSAESLDRRQVVLLADDDRSMRALLKATIVRQGYQVIEAANGKIALAILRELQPDLVLLDGLMPEMDGFTCCTQLRVDFPDLPVLMITALDDPESVDRAFEVGATDYITKPVNWAVLRQRLRKLLGASLQPVA